METKGLKTWINGAITEFFFNAKELVVLGDTFGAVWSTGLDLTRIEGDDEVGNGRILGFARTMGDDCGPASILSHLNGFDGFG